VTGANQMVTTQDPAGHRTCAAAEYTPSSPR
jgi:hypothetical protein